jgi:sulfur carrier protein ThiS
LAVAVELSSGLRRHVPGYDPAAGLKVEAAGRTAAELVESLGLPPGEVQVIMVNRRAARTDAVLADGDLVGLFPALGGG